MTQQRRKDDVLTVANRRRDGMFCAAYLAVIGLVYVVVIEPINEYGQGVITLVLGAFVGYLTSMYSFETGTTRSSGAKDAAITDLTKAAVVTADTAQAIKNDPVVTPAPATPAQKAEGIIPAAEVAAPPEPKP